ncbi:hypothetical protein S245_045842, partial [Arachis hypogaea]
STSILPCIFGFEVRFLDSSSSIFVLGLKFDSILWSAMVGWARQTAVSPHFNLHADQGKWLEEGDDSCSEQDGGANDSWDHVIGTAQSQTRNMGRVGNTVDWNIE